MSQFFESIKIHHRRIYNIDAHNRRIAESRKQVLGLDDILDLRDCIVLPESLDGGLYKCRISYDQTIQHIEFIPYKPKIIRTLCLIHNDLIRYEHKYKDRSCLEMLIVENADDILIIQNGLLTDTSHANIALFDGLKWFTPRRPLLRGTKRAVLIEQKLIHEADIRYEHVQRFHHAALLNAMLDIGDIPFIPVKNIFQA